MSGHGEVIDLSPDALQRRRVDGNLRLVDVSEALEHWLERIAGSEVQPLSSLSPGELATDAAALVLYCRSGSRSAIAAARISAAAGLPVHHLEGGIRAWKAQGNAVERFGSKRGGKA